MSTLLRLTVPLLAIAVMTAGCPDLIQPQAQGPGAKYEAYLTGTETLVLELDYAPGNKPTSKVLDALRQEAGRITAKSVEIRQSRDLPDRDDSTTWTVDQLKELHQQHQDHEDGPGQVVMHGLLVDGGIKNDQVAGLAFLEDTFAIAMGTMRENTCSDGALVCGGQPEFSNAVRAVAVHEAGHLFGLVAITLPMVEDHEDEDHPGHSDNDRSVMWWQVEVGTQLGNLFDRGSSIPYQFDSNDMQDARTLRSG